jgi:hypothetical protein
MKSACCCRFHLSVGVQQKIKRSQLFCTNLYADEIKQHMKELWEMVIFSH